MTREMIRRSFILSFCLCLLFSISLASMYFGAIFGIISEGFALFLGVIGTIFLGIGAILFIFGVFVPVIGQFAYHNVFSTKRRKQLASFKVWRFLLNLNGESVMFPRRD